VSDERDGADSAGDDAETAEATPVRGRTAVAARSQQPRGKKSRASGEDVETTAIELGTTKNGTGKKKTAKKGESRGNPITFVLTYIKQVIAELRKVIWPNRKQMVTYTAVVLAFVVFMVALVSVLDLAFKWGIGKIFG
jgi:preprotein translocase subunit SecE